MARYYRTSGIQPVDFVYNQPTEFMYQVLKEQDAKVNQLQDQQYLFETTAGNVPLQVLSEYRDTASKAVEPYMNRINEYASILNNGDAKEYLRQQGTLRRLGQDLNKELTTGNTGRLVQNTQAYNEYVKRVQADKNIDPALRESFLNSRYSPDGYIRNQIQNTVSSGALSLPEIPNFYDVKKDLLETAQKLGIDKNYVEEIVRQGPNALPGYFTKNKITKDGVNPEQAAAAFSAILNDPRYIAGEDFRDNYLGQRYVQAGKDLSGNPLYLANEGYVNNRLNNVAKNYGYETVQDHLGSIQKNYQDKADQLMDLLMSKKITQKQYNERSKTLLDNLSNESAPIKREYDIARNLASFTSNTNDAVLGRDLRRRELMSYANAVTPGDVTKLETEYIKDYLTQMRTQYSYDLGKIGAKHKNDLDLTKLKHANALDLEDRKQQGRLGLELLRQAGDVDTSSSSGKGSAQVKAMSQLTEGTGMFFEKPVEQKTYTSMQTDKNAANERIKKIDTELQTANLTPQRKAELIREKTDRQNSINNNNIQIEQFLERNPNFFVSLENEYKGDIKKLNDERGKTWRGRGGYNDAYTGKIDNVWNDTSLQKVIMNNGLINSKAELASLIGVGENLLMDQDVQFAQKMFNNLKSDEVSNYGLDNSFVKSLKPSSERRRDSEKLLSDFNTDLNNNVNIGRTSSPVRHVNINNIEQKNTVNNSLKGVNVGLNDIYGRPIEAVIDGKTYNTSDGLVNALGGDITSVLSGNVGFEPTENGTTIFTIPVNSTFKYHTVNANGKKDKTTDTGTKAVRIEVPNDRITNLPALLSNPKDAVATAVNSYYLVPNLLPLRKFMDNLDYQPVNELSKRIGNYNIHGVKNYDSMGDTGYNFTITDVNTGQPVTFPSGSTVLPAKSVDRAIDVILQTVLNK